MLTQKDIVVFPDLRNWETKQDVFTVEERAEIIFLLERIAWKRNMHIAEMDVAPYVNRKLEFRQGMLELTQGYAMLTKENLFDTDSKLSKEQVKLAYCKPEKRFAESTQGTVSIPKELCDKVKVIFY